MAQDIEWDDRLHGLLTGALAVWRIEGLAVKDTKNRTACTVHTAAGRVAVERVTGDGETPYWEVSALDQDLPLPPLPYAGIQGMLRAVRDLLDPDNSGARLVIGQPVNGQ
jgi:hypothetical protein